MTQVVSVSGGGSVPERGHWQLNPTRTRRTEQTAGFLLGTDLEEAREDVKLEDRDVVVAGEVNGGLEGHGLQAGTDGVHFVKALSKDFPGHYCPERQHICSLMQREAQRDHKETWITLELKATHT